MAEGPQNNETLHIMHIKGKPDHSQPPLKNTLKTYCTLFHLITSDRNLIFVG